jgi:hypothetical protein
MPTYELDIGGKTHEIESDNPLTDAQLSEYAKRLTAPAAKPTPKQDDPVRLPQTAGETATALKKGLLGLGDVALSATTGGLATPVSGLAGVGSAVYAALTGKDDPMRAGAETQKSVQERMTWAPRTEEGQAGAALLGKPMEMAKAYSGKVGRAIGEKVSAPIAGESIGEAVPEAAAALLGAKQMLKSRGALTPGAPLSQAREAIASAQRSGFMADPVEANPSMGTKLAGTIADRRRVQDNLSVKNAEIAATKLKKDLGIAPDGRLDLPTLEGIRGAAGQKYQAIKDLKVDIPMDQTYLDTIKALDSKFESLKEFAPDLYRHPDLERVRGALAQPKSPAHPNTWTPKSLLEISQNLREKANRVLKQKDVSDEAFNEAAALKAGATAMEDLLERQLTPTGTQRVATNFRAVQDFRKAREQIAKTYDVEAATNLVSGVVDPQKLRKIVERGGTLSGGLREVADAAAAMPSVMRSPESISPDVYSHIGDWGAAGVAAGAATLHPGLAAGALVRPGTRAALSSKLYQDKLGQVKPSKPTRQYSMKEAAKGAAAAEIATAEEKKDEAANN